MQLIGRRCKPLSREMPITTTEPQSCLVKSSVWMSKCDVYWIKQLIQTFLAGPGKAGSHGCEYLYTTIYIMVTKRCLVSVFNMSVLMQANHKQKSLYTVLTAMPRPSAMLQRLATSKIHYRNHIQTQSPASV